MARKLDLLDIAGHFDGERFHVSGSAERRPARHHRNYNLVGRDSVEPWEVLTYTQNNSCTARR